MIVEREREREREREGERVEGRIHVGPRQKMTNDESCGKAKHLKFAFRLKIEILIAGIFRHGVQFKTTSERPPVATQEMVLLGSSYIHKARLIH